MFDSLFSSAQRAIRAGKADIRLHVLSVFSLAVAFVCLASALLIVVNLQAVQNRWSRAGHVSIYLRDGASDDEVLSLQSALDQTPGVVDARFVSPAEARKQFLGDGVEGSLASLPIEAFPASIELKLADDLAPEAQAGMVSKLLALPQVDSVETYERWTDRLASLVSGGVAASGVLAIVVFGAVVAVVASTMRLAMQRRQIEIEVLKLVGATDQFVRRPFILEGAMQGALGSLGAIALLGLLFLMVRDRFDASLAALLGIKPVFLPLPVVLGMVGIGAILGALASFAGVRKLSAV